MAENAAALLRRADTDEALAAEVLGGGLRPALHLVGERKTQAELDEAEDDESDEVFVQIKMLLASAMNSGQLRSLARAVVLAWQAGYDSKLLRQAEPRMMRKAQEVQLGADLQEAMARRNRIQLTDCLNTANELALTETNFPPLRGALALERELEEEIRKSQDEARPGHTNKMQTVIAELHRKLIGHDLVQLQDQVVKEAAAAELSMKDNSQKLADALSRLEKCKAAVTSSSKLTELKDLQAIFHEVSPRNQEDQVKSLTQQVDDLREDNARLMLAMRSGGNGVVYLSESSANDSTLSGEAVVAELQALRTRVAELEENEETLKGRIDQAAKLGAKWMEDKKNSEIEELTQQMEDRIAAAKATSDEDTERTVKRRVMEAQKHERQQKLTALSGLEKNLNMRHEENLNNLRAQYEEAMMNMQVELDNTVGRLRQMEKIIKMRG